MKSQEERSHARHIARRPHGRHDEGRQRPQGSAQDHRTEFDHDDRAGEDVVGPLVVTLAQGDGDGNRRAHTDEVAKRKGDDDEGHGETDRRKGGLSQELPHEDAIGHVIEGGAQHAERTRQRRLEEEPTWRRLGKETVGDDALALGDIGYQVAHGSISGSFR